MLKVVGDTSFERLPERLRTLAERALANARRELELTGKLNPSAFLDDEQLRFSDEDARALYGTKSRRQFFFRSLRKAVAAAGVTSVILVSDIWTGWPTEKLESLPRAEAEKILAETPGLRQLAAQGWITRHEAILVCAQTREQVALVEQAYDADRVNRRITWGPRRANCFPQEVFEGTTKMFGYQEAANENRAG